MEVLVAASIFAIVMVMTTGVLGQSSTYDSKIKKMRETSEESRRLADMITRDVKLARKQIVIENDFVSLAPGDNCADDNFGDKTIKSGIAILAGRSNDFCLEYIDYDGLNPNAASFGQYDSRMLIIGGDDTYKIYYSKEGTVYYRNDIPTETTLTPNILLNEIPNSNYAVTSSEYKSYVGFGGFAPIEDAKLKIQPSVKFLITVKEQGYDETNHKGVQATIQSWVTSRNYDI